jgi:hypothetical protein
MGNTVIAKHKAFAPFLLDGSVSVRGSDGALPRPANTPLKAMMSFVVIWIVRPSGRETFQCPALADSLSRKDMIL